MKNEYMMTKINVWHCPVNGGGNDQLIGSTVSEVIVRSWLWSTATKNCPLGYISRITASSW